MFDGASPSLARALLIASKELHYWGLAGARGINYLLALVQVRVKFRLWSTFLVKGAHVSL